MPEEDEPGGRPGRSSEGLAWRRAGPGAEGEAGPVKPRAAHRPTASFLVGKDMGQRAAPGPSPLSCLLLPHGSVSPGRSGPQEKDPPPGARALSNLLCDSRHVPSLLWGLLSPSVNCEDLAKFAAEPLPVLRQVFTLATTTAAMAPLRPGSGELAAGLTVDVESRWLQRAGLWHPTENKVK